MVRSQKVAVVGAGISGLSAAWLLSRGHEVTLFESEPRPGGHSHTVDVPGPDRAVPVDTGFIVYNVASYPNLVALFEHLSVPTAPTRMGFAVSLDGGTYEYSGSGLSGLFGQPRNLASPGHWRMIADTMRFFREARELAGQSGDDAGPTLGDYLRQQRYSSQFVERHILPMAAAIWSTPSGDVMAFPAKAFARFFHNHGLLQVSGRSPWRTVAGGSREYVRRLLADFRGQVATGNKVRAIERHAGGVDVIAQSGRATFDACVIATHADQALSLLGDADGEERRLLGAFRYRSNLAVLHRDPSLMPRRRRLWSSWNYLATTGAGERQLSVSYWMNELQPLGPKVGDVFVTLNPGREIASDRVVASFDYAHPIFDQAAMAAQRDLWQLQGQRRTWFCGSYFGYGFHEDGLQSGLWVAEDIGGVRRPWQVAGESGRLSLGPRSRPVQARQAESVG